MMKSKKSLMQVALFVFAILIGASCVPKDAGVEEVLLTVSSDKVILEATSIESVAKVDVNTNYTEWETSTNASWLQATRRGDNILLSASANTDDKERNADLMIYAGVKVKKVRVTQAGGGTSSATMSLEVNPLTIEVPKDGKKYLIRVNSNDDKWEVETADENANWVIPRIFPGFIELEVSANNTSAERTTKLFVKLGTDTKEITVSQKMAPSAAKYTLPLFELKMDHRKLLNYEEGTLGNKLLLFTRGRLSVDMMSGKLLSKPNSYLFASLIDTYDEVTYQYTHEQQLLNLILIRSSNYEAFSRAEFMPFLEKNGFEFLKEEDEEYQWYAYKRISPTMRVVVEIERDESTGTLVRFAPVFNQEGVMPTYSSFPYEAKNLIDEKIKVDPLKQRMETAKWKNPKTRTVAESKRKSYNLDKYGSQIYDLFVTAPNPDTDDVIHRRFLFDWRTKTEENDSTALGNVWQVWEYRKDVSKVLWQNPYGKWELTDEFKELLEKEGFEKDPTNRDKTHDYYKDVMVGNKKMKFVLSADCIQADDVNQGENTLLIMYWYR